MIEFKDKINCRPEELEDTPYRIYRTDNPDLVYRGKTNFWQVYTGDRGKNTERIRGYVDWGNACAALEPILRDLGMTSITQLRIRLGKQTSVIPRKVNKHDLDLGTQLKPEQMCFPVGHMMGYVINDHRDFDVWLADSLVDGYMVDLNEESGGLCRQGFYSRLIRQRTLEFGGGQSSKESDAYFVKENRDGLIDMVQYLVEEQGKSNRNPAAILRTAMVINGGIRRLNEIEKFQRETEEAESCAVNYFRAERNFEAAKEEIIKTKEPVRNLPKVMKPFRDELKGLGRPEEPIGRLAVAGEVHCIVNADTAVCGATGEITRQGWIPDLMTSLGEYSERFNLTIMRILSYLFHQLAGNLVPSKRDKMLKLAALGGSHRDIGGDGNHTVAVREKMRRKMLKAKGIIIYKPYNCTPQIVAENIMSAIKDGIPCLTISVDEHTGGAGIATRIEAYTDLLARRSGKRPRRIMIPTW